MGSPQRQGGYLLIDHRASPGTPDVPSGTIFEADTFTCCHCNVIVWKNPKRTRERHMCWKCAHLTCDRPGCVNECNPIIQAVTLAQRFPDAGQPFLIRGPHGEVLFDSQFKDKETFG